LKLSEEVVIIYSG